MTFAYPYIIADITAFLYVVFRVLRMSAAVTKYHQSYGWFTVRLKTRIGFLQASSDQL